MFFKTSALAILSVVIATAGQLFLRAGMSRVGYIGRAELSRPMNLLLTVAKTPQVVAGLGFFVLSAASWLLVLSRVPLSFAYPFVGLTYILTTLFSKFVLKEQIPLLRWAGIFLIVAGIVTVGATSPAEPTHNENATASNSADS